MFCVPIVGQALSYGRRREEDALVFVHKESSASMGKGGRGREVDPGSYCMQLVLQHR